MPRVLRDSACLTCRRRKLKCDEQLPICGRCSLAGRFCERASGVQLKPREKSAAAGAALPSPSNPQAALQDERVARLFHHYTSSLAPWYDLSDAERTFSRQVPYEALSFPLLFSAILAFAAIHLAHVKGLSSRANADHFHAFCVDQLIRLEPNKSQGGLALAAVCLLRSYEILAEDFDPNRHLSGAFALADGQRIVFDPPSLLRAGFFNYLREDITYSLTRECPLKIDPLKLSAPYIPKTDEDQLNIASLHLAQAINEVFDPSSQEHKRLGMLEQVNTWRINLPGHFEPYFGPDVDESTTTFPNVYLLQDCHAATLQYYIVAFNMLLQSVSSARSTDKTMTLNAIRLCSLAFTSSRPTVVVNSFGPISWCCKFLKPKPLQEELIRRLHGYRKQTGWPVHRVVEHLQQSWNMQASSSPGGEQCISRAS